MLNRYKLILIFISSVILCGQSIYNSVGLGTALNSASAAAAGTGSTGLVPSLSSGLSLENPVTWNKSPFALLSTTVIGERLNLAGGQQNGSTEIGSIQLILPVKGRTAWGFSLNPLTSNVYTAVGPQTTQVIYEDTVKIKNSVDGAGGMNSLKIAYNFPLTATERNAIALEFIFGSSRYAATTELNSLPYVTSRHDSYSGLMVDYYLSSDRFSNKQRPLTLYLSVGFTVKPVRVVSDVYHLYEDKNEDGFYSSTYDFPGLLSEDYTARTVSKDVQKPIKLAVGFNYGIADYWAVQGEFTRKSYNSNLPSALQSFLGSEYLLHRHFSLGVIKFGRSIPREWYDHFHYRIGVFSKALELDGYQDLLSETGVTSGLGWRFGKTGNQLDIAYSVGWRKGPLHSGSETIERLKFQLTLGDIWFVKRRPR